MAGFFIAAAGTGLLANVLVGSLAGRRAPGPTQEYIDSKFQELEKRILDRILPSSEPREEPNEMRLLNEKINGLQNEFRVFLEQSERIHDSRQSHLLTQNSRFFEKIDHWERSLKEGFNEMRRLFLKQHQEILSTCRHQHPSPHAGRVEPRLFIQPANPPGADRPLDDGPV